MKIGSEAVIYLIESSSNQTTFFKRSNVRIIQYNANNLEGPIRFSALPRQVVPQNHLRMIQDPFQSSNSCGPGFWHFLYDHLFQVILLCIFRFYGFNVIKSARFRKLLTYFFGTRWVRGDTFVEDFCEILRAWKPTSQCDRGHILIRYPTSDWQPVPP